MQASTHDPVQGTVFNIQRFSIHDGPGIRTTVFLKGCSLRCFWCHNPESIRPGPEIQLFPDKCIACDACIEACPEGARFLEDGLRVLDRSRCTACGRCVETCFAGSLTLVGTIMTADDVISEVLRDRAFYGQSGGGVTLSGGEPALQPEFAHAILAGCKREGIHTAIETAGNVPWDFLARLLPVLDLVMMDLKHMNPAKHRWATGASNERVLANARRLAGTELPILFRVPVIPTVNDSSYEVEAIAGFAAELRAGRVRRGSVATIDLDLLQFHKLAGDKYRSLGLPDRAADLQPLSKARMAELRAAARGN
jgi:pyruvate formate lyase activating enzyme